MSNSVDRRSFIKLGGILAASAVAGGVVSYVNRQPPNHADVNPGLPLPEGHYPEFQATMVARSEGVEQVDLEFFPKDVLSSVYYTSILDAGTFGPSLGSSTIVDSDHINGVGASILSLHQTGGLATSNDIRLLRFDTDPKGPLDIVQQSKALFTRVRGAYDMAIATYLTNDRTRFSDLGQNKILPYNEFDFVRGQELFCVGFPDSDYGPYMTRVISFRRQFISSVNAEGEVAYSDEPVDEQTPNGILTVQCVGGFGMSGAGVFDHRGYMVGILRGGEEKIQTGYVSLFPKDIHRQLSDSIKSYN